MDCNQMNRLSDKTSEELVICEQKIQSWNKFADDYKALEERLTTLTDKTRHEIMVPIGGSDLAFMNGYIKHTNEILVLLGDNYFVERSSKQAIDIVDRRLKNCQTMIEGLNEEKRRLEEWLAFEKRFSDEKKTKEFVEIVEEFDEQKERQWREEHKRRVREYKLSEKTNTKTSDDMAINKRLKELELQEMDPKRPELKSILKKDTKCDESAGSVGDSTVVADNSETEAQSREMAFKNEIIERDVNDDRESMATTKLEVKSSPKIVSRFKANRMKK